MSKRLSLPSPTNWRTTAAVKVFVSLAISKWSRPEMGVS
jgi:hypothetical protein